MNIVRFAEYIADFGHYLDILGSDWVELGRWLDF